MERIKKKYLNWVLGLSKKRSRQGLYEFLATEFSKIPSHSKVLTVGAGGEVNDLLDQHAKLQNFECLSFDIDITRDPDLLGDICDYNFQPSSFDTVVMSEVLEHLHSPKQGVSNVYKTLKPSGVLILSTPFILPIHDQPHDYFRFTRYGLALLLKDFNSIKINERNSYFEAIDVLWVRLLQANLRSAKYASLIVIPVIFFLKRPLSILLSKLIPTDSMTTGYVVTATK